MTLNINNYQESTLIFKQNRQNNTAISQAEIFPCNQCQLPLRTAFYCPEFILSLPILHLSDLSMNQDPTLSFHHQVLCRLTCLLTVEKVESIGNFPAPILLSVSVWKYKTTEADTEYQLLYCMAHGVTLSEWLSIDDLFIYDINT